MSGLFETMSQTNPEFVDSAENFANAAAASAREAEISAASAKSDLTQTRTNVQLAQQARQDAQAVVAGIETTKNEALAAKEEVKAIKASVDAIKVDVDATRVEISTSVSSAQNAGVEARQAAAETEVIKTQTEAMLNTKGAAADKALVDAKAYSDSNKQLIDDAVAKARDWAIKPGIDGPVEGENGNEQYSAKYWAQRAQIIAETKGVITFNGRQGSVVPAAGDYTAAQVGALPTNWRPRWPTDVINAPGFHNLALSGHWNDISGKPTIIDPMGDQSIYGKWRFMYSSLPYVRGQNAGVDIGPNGRITSNENDGNTGMKSIRIGVGGVGSGTNYENSVEFRLRSTGTQGRAIPEIWSEGNWKPVYFGEQKPVYSANDVGAIPKDPTNTFLNAVLASRDGNSFVEAILNSTINTGAHQDSASLSRYVRESILRVRDKSQLQAAIGAQPASSNLDQLDRPTTSFFASLQSSTDEYDFRTRIGANSLISGNLLKLDQDNSAFSLQALKKLNGPEWLAHLGAQPASANLNVLDFPISPWALARMKDATKQDTINALGLGASGGLYYTQTEINDNFYTKAQVYPKSYIDGNMVTTTTVSTEINRLMADYSYTKVAADDKFVTKTAADAKYFKYTDMNVFFNRDESDARYYKKTDVDNLFDAQNVSIAQTYITKQDAPLTFVTQASLAQTVSQAVDNKISAAGLATTTQLAGKVDKTDPYWVLVTGNNYMLKSGMDQYYTKLESNSRYVTSSAGEAYNSARLEGLTKAQLTQEIVNLVGPGGGGSGGGTVVDAYTKIESDDKYYSKTQANITFLTPAQGAAAFMASGEAYPKAQTYSQTEADNKFALKSASVTTTSLNSTLNNYLTKTSFNTTISDYIKTADADGKYTTNTFLNTNYYTKTQTEAQITAAKQDLQFRIGNVSADVSQRAMADSVYEKDQSDARYISSSKESTFLTTASLGANYYTKAQIDANNWMQTATANTSFLTKTGKAADSTLLAGKTLDEVKAYTLSGFTPGGQVDAYTKSESDAKYATITGIAANNYTKQEADTAFQTKADTTDNYYNKSQADAKFALITSLSSYQTKTQADSLYALKTTVSGLLTQATGDTLYLGKTSIAADSAKFNNKTLDEVKTYVLDGYSGGGASSKDGLGGDYRQYYYDSRPIGIAYVPTKNFGTGVNEANSTEDSFVMGNAVVYGSANYNAMLGDRITAIGTKIQGVGGSYDTAYGDLNNTMLNSGVYIGSKMMNGARNKVGGGFAANEIGNVMIGNYNMYDAVWDQNTKANFTTYEQGLVTEGIVSIGEKAGRIAMARSVSIGAEANGINTNQVMAGFASVAVGNRTTTIGAQSVAVGYNNFAMYSGDIMMGANNAIYSTASITGNTRNSRSKMTNSSTLSNSHLYSSVIISNGFNMSEAGLSSHIVIGRQANHHKHGSIGTFTIGINNDVPDTARCNIAFVGNNNRVSGPSAKNPVMGGNVFGNGNQLTFSDADSQQTQHTTVIGSVNQISMTNGSEAISRGPIVIGSLNNLDNARIGDFSNKTQGQHILIGNGNYIRHSSTNNTLQCITIGQVGDQNSSQGAFVVDNQGSLIIGSSISLPQSTVPTMNRTVEQGSVIIGYNMLSGANSSSATVGSNNVLIGTGICNVANGTSISHSNVFIGNGAGWDPVSKVTSLARCFAIGRNAYVTGNDQGQLGDSGTTVYANKAIAIRSDARDKLDVKDSTLGLDFIMKLRPVEYRLNFREAYHDIEEVKDKDGNVIDTIATTVPNDGSRAGKRFHCGLIAQEVESTLEEMGRDWAGLIDGKRDGGADRYSVIYQEVIGPMIKAMQEQQAQIEELKSQVTALLQKK